MKQELKISEYAKKVHCTVRTVWNRINAGRLEAKKTDHGWRILLDDGIAEPRYAVYARVSSAENRDNLERQKQRLLDFCAANGWKVSKAVEEVGSGLNDERKKLAKLLADESITHIVVEHKDRFSRFGFRYVEQLLQQQGRCIVVINEQDSERDELMEDFVSIITSFTARLYGRRRSRRRTEKLIAELKKDNG